MYLGKVEDPNWPLTTNIDCSPRVIDLLACSTLHTTKEQRYLPFLGMQCPNSLSRVYRA